MAESILYCAKRLQGVATTRTNEEYRIEFIDKRKEVTKAVHGIISMRTLYLLEDYEAAFIEVWFFYHPWGNIFFKCEFVGIFFTPHGNIFFIAN